MESRLSGSRAEVVSNAVERSLVTNLTSLQNVNFQGATYSSPLTLTPTFPPPSLVPTLLFTSPSIPLIALPLPQALLPFRQISPPPSTFPHNLLVSTTVPPHRHYLLPFPSATPPITPFSLPYLLFFFPSPPP